MENKTPLIEFLDESGSFVYPKEVDVILNAMGKFNRKSDKLKSLSDTEFKREVEVRTLQMMDVMIYGMMIVFGLIAFMAYRRFK